MSRSHGLAVAAIPLLILISALSALEVWLRVERFGWIAVRRPLDFMAPKWRRPDCLRAHPDGDFMVPSCRMRHKGVTVTTNSVGLHDREVDEDAPHYRILVLGDSLTMADGVALPDLFHTRLETRLDQKLDAPGFVELYNTGRGGNATALELRDLEKSLARWEIDAVLVAVSPSDLWENVQERHSCGPGHEPLQMNREDRRAYDRSVRGRNPLTRAIGDVEAVTGLWAINRARDLARRVVRALNRDDDVQDRLGDRARAAFRLCAGRLRERVDREGIPLAWVLSWYAPDPQGEILVEELRELGEPILSVMDVHRELDPRELSIYAGDSHPSVRVHRAFADRIEAWLEELGWLAAAREAHRSRP